MKKIIVVLLLLQLVTFHRALALEPRVLDPNLDADFIDSLGLSDPRQSDRFNILLIGYDLSIDGMERSKASRRYTNGRNRLGLSSRSDIMMLVSFDKKRRQIDILSIGRDFVPSPSCYQRAPHGMTDNLRYKGAGKINASIVYYGRRVMIHCLRSVMTEGIANTSASAEFDLESDGLLPIHSLYEFQRGKDADSSVIGQIKGQVLDNLFSTLSLAWSYSDSLRTLVSMSGRYVVMFQGLKRRDYAVAGSYQRAFNNAKFVADAIAWTAPGVQASKEDGYNLLDWDIFSPIDNIASATHSVSELNSLLSYYPQGSRQAVDHMLRYGAFIKNPGTGAATRDNPFGPNDAVSPVRIFQFGGDIRSYAVYQNGVLDTAGVYRSDFLRGLRVRPVMQLPGESVQMCPDCHVQPSLPAGGWGLPYFEGLAGERLENP